MYEYLLTNKRQNPNTCLITKWNHAHSSLFLMPSSLHALLSSPSNEWVTKMLLSLRQRVPASFAKMDSQEEKRLNTSARDRAQQKLHFLGIRKAKVRDFQTPKCWDKQQSLLEFILENSLLRHRYFFPPSGEHFWCIRWEWNHAEALLKLSWEEMTCSAWVSLAQYWSLPCTAINSSLDGKFLNTGFSQTPMAQGCLVGTTTISIIIKEGEHPLPNLQKEITDFQKGAISPGLPSAPQLLKTLHNQDPQLMHFPSIPGQIVLSCN